MKKVVLVLSIVFLFSGIATADAPLNSKDFYFQGMTYFDAATGIVKMLGYFVNDSDQFVKSARFGAFIYDYSDELLDAQYFIVSNLNPGESRPIKLFFECKTKDDISQIEVRFINLIE